MAALNPSSWSSKNNSHRFDQSYYSLVNLDFKVNVNQSWEIWHNTQVASTSEATSTLFYSWTAKRKIPNISMNNIIMVLWDTYKTENYKTGHLKDRTVNRRSQENSLVRNDTCCSIPFLWHIRISSPSLTCGRLELNIHGMNTNLIASAKNQVKTIIS